MNDQAKAFVRGFGDLSQRLGGIAWNLRGEGAVKLEHGRVSGTEPTTVSGGSSDWVFETQLESGELDGAAIFRHVAVQAPEGGTIVCTAVGSAGISGHGEERTGGSLHVGGDEIPYEEVLISTQYDAAGDPTRVGLELWATGADQTSRAAATRIAGSLLGGARSGGAWAGFFRCHADGTEGLGTYLIWRG